jgi:hypothetical protein
LASCGSGRSEVPATRVSGYRAGSVRDHLRASTPPVRALQMTSHSSPPGFRRWSLVARKHALVSRLLRAAQGNRAGGSRTGPRARTLTLGLAAGIWACIFSSYANAYAVYPYVANDETLYSKWGDNHAGTPGGRSPGGSYRPVRPVQPIAATSALAPVERRSISKIHRAAVTR